MNQHATHRRALLLSAASPWAGITRPRGEGGVGP
jgi:hypothetical protein